MNKPAGLLFTAFILSCWGCSKNPPANPFQFNTSAINQGVTQNNTVLSSTSSEMKAVLDMCIIPPDNGAEPAITSLAIANIIPLNFSGFTYTVDSVISVSNILTANYNNILLIDQSDATINASLDTGSVAYLFSSDIYGSNYRISGIQYYMVNAITNGNISVYAASSNGLLGAGPLSYVTSRSANSQNYIAAISNLSLQMKGSNSIMQALNALVTDSIQTAGAIPLNITVFSHGYDTIAQPTLVSSITAAAIQKKIKINFLHFAGLYQGFSGDYLEVANLTGGFFSYTSTGQDYILICKNIDALLHSSLPANKIYYHINSAQAVFDNGYWLRDPWNFAIQSDTEKNYIQVFTKIY